MILRGVYYNSEPMFDDDIERPFVLVGDGPSLVRAISGHYPKAECSECSIRVPTKPQYTFTQEWPKDGGST